MSDPPPRQYRLATLMIGVTLAALLFAWVRTWDSSTRDVFLSLGGYLAAWALPVVGTRRLVRSSLFRARSYVFTVVISQCWFPANIVGFFIVNRLQSGSDVASVAYFAALAMSVAAATAVVVTLSVDRMFQRWTQEKRALVCGAVATPLLIVVAVCYFVGARDLLFVVLLIAIVGLFSFGLFVPFGMIFALRAMDLRSVSSKALSVDVSQPDEPLAAAASS